MTIAATMAAAAALVLACTSCDSGPDPEIAVIRMADGGVIRLRFHTAEAPRTVRNFKKLVREGFYDGVSFHRVIPGFIVQTGDPNTRDDDPENDGYGGPGYTIDDEFNPKLKHVRGTVSMAHPEKPNSAGSQFFIVLSEQGEGGEDWHPLLDGKYAAFAEVEEGMDVADAIAQVPRISPEYPHLADHPVDAPVIASIRIEERPEGEKGKAEAGGQGKP